ncbi:MAG: hypothetical protein J2P20_18265, partial [Pseudonocardia sp.]|nr:hypothetical protein [Pseudonocardia sp.]
MAAGELAQTEAGQQAPAEPEAPAKAETNAHGAAAHGEEPGHEVRPVEAAELPVGSVVTPSG